MQGSIGLPRVEISARQREERRRLAMLGTGERMKGKANARRQSAERRVMSGGVEETDGERERGEESVRSGGQRGGVEVVRRRRARPVERWIMDVWQKVDE